MNIKLNIGKERERKEPVRHAHTLLYRPTARVFTGLLSGMVRFGSRPSEGVLERMFVWVPDIESFLVLYRPRLIDGNSFMFGGYGKGRSHEGVARIKDMRSAHNNIYNFDETGFAIGIRATVKVICSSDCSGKLSLIQLGNRE
jgi:hypothetical protein